MIGLGVKYIQLVKYVPAAVKITDDDHRSSDAESYEERRNRENL